MWFVDWDSRPAVLFEASAVALLTPGSDWVEVDWMDVGETGKMLRSEAELRAAFGWEFGDFALPKATAKDGSI